MIHNFLYVIIVRLTYLSFPNCDVKVIKRTFKIIFTLLKKNGTLFTVKYIKTCRLLITRYMCGRPLLVNSSFVSSKRGFPTKFLFLKSYIDSGKTEHIKFCLTLLNISRTILPKKGEEIPIDFNSITDGPVKQFKTVPGFFVNKFINEYNLVWEIPTYTTKDFFISLKMGPHGPTILSITETVKYLGSSIMESIQFLIGKDFFSKYVGPFISFVNHNNINIPNGSGEDNIFTHKSSGRLSIIRDPECKMRVIAIADYYTQFTLKPIHKMLMNLLRKLPCDRTFTQDPFHKWEGNDPFYSLDLSSATDRFPVHLQKKLLNYLVFKTSNDIIYSFKYSEFWMKLLINRVFTYKETDYKYAVGQPMGCYSSWAAFTLAHHLVVQFCAYKKEKFPFNNYIILGDDIVVKDNEVAREYIKFMTKLGVSISPHKTHVSKDTYEFAKRWIRYTPTKGYVELSPIPLKGISNNIDNPFIVYTILMDYYIIKGNQYLSRLNIISLVIRLYNNLVFKTFVKGKLVKSVTFSNRFLRTKLLMLDLSMRISLGINTDTQIREYLCKVLYDQDWYTIPSESTILKKEFFRVLGVSIYPSIQDGLNNLSKLKRRFAQYWALSFNQPNKLNYFPLFHSINNWIKDLEQFTEDYNSGKVNNLTLYELSKLVNFLDINELFMWDRNFHSTITQGGKLLSKARNGLKDTRLESFEYDIPGYDRELKEKISWMAYSIEQFTDYTKTVEQGIAKPLPQKQVEAYVQLSKRHGGAFLL